MTAGAWLLAGLGSVLFMAMLAKAKDPQPLSADPEATRKEAEAAAYARRIEARVEKAKLLGDAWWECRVDRWAGRLK